LWASKLAQLVIEGNIRVGLTAAQPYPQPDAPLSSTDADDRLANHCAILECLKAIAPLPAEVLTRLDLPPSQNRQKGKEPAHPVCLPVSKQPSKAPKQSKKQSSAFKIAVLDDNDDLYSQLGPNHCGV